MNIIEPEKIQYVTGINNLGQVIGTGYNHLASYSYVTSPNGANASNLGSLGGFKTETTAINDSGKIVGTSSIHGYGHNNEYDHAFIFSHGGMTDLTMLPSVVASGWARIRPTDLNDNGQIVGYGINNEGHNEAFLISYTPDTVFTPQPIYIQPIPEPETYAMLLTGLGLIGFMTWRKKVTCV